MVLTVQQKCKTVLAQIPKNVRLIAASKTQPIATLKAAFAAGITHFGENYVQEGAVKAPQLPEATWHFIGKLQTNKTHQAVRFFDVFHTVDSLNLITKLDHAASNAHKTIEIFLQVNLSHEPQKAGCTETDLPTLIAAATAAKNLNLVGLMTLPPATEDPTPYFAKLAALAKTYGLPRLSVGMSGDWQVAIKHGATDIRLGTALFGGRG